MKLYEFQGKRLFSEYAIPVSKGELCLRRDSPVKVSPPAVLKAQVLSGGRGKAGGIKMWDGTTDFSESTNEIFSMDLKGERVGAILVEEKAEILQELYLSITFGGSKATPVIIASAAGGMDIEAVASETPDKIITVPFDPLLGPADFQARYISKALGYENYKELKSFVEKLYLVFKQSDATLVEINPLAITPQGLLALDAKIVLDDKAKYRQSDLFNRLLQEQVSINRMETRHEDENTITYVPLSGSIGMISDGAGTGMLTLDLISDFGGKAATFCEMGGITNPKVMYDAIVKVLGNKDVKSLLIVLIGGFNRMDELAEGIINYHDEHGIEMPLVVRMVGTMEDEGKEMMKKVGIPTCDDLVEAVRKIVELTEGK